MRDWVMGSLPLFALAQQKLEQRLGNRILASFLGLISKTRLFLNPLLQTEK
jgi:hypothetical protein